MIKDKEGPINPAKESKYNIIKFQYLYEFVDINHRVTYPSNIWSNFKNIIK